MFIIILMSVINSNSFAAAAAQVDQRLLLSAATFRFPIGAVSLVTGGWGRGWGWAEPREEDWDIPVRCIQGACGGYTASGGGD